MKGISVDSLPSNGLTAEDKPQVAVSGLSIVSTSTTTASMNWTELVGMANVGYSNVTSYIIYIDRNDGNGLVYLGTSYGYSNVQVNGLVKGITYRFAVSAVNSFGEGPQSNPVSLISAQVPSVMNPPTISQSGVNALISWTLNSQSNGSPILGYHVYIMTPSASNSYVEYTSLCDGSGSTTTSCSVPMTSIISTLGYTAGQTIYAKISSYNSKGESILS